MIKRRTSIKRLESIPGKWMLTIMLALFLTTCYFVPNNRVHLLEQKSQLIQQEQKLIAQEEAGTPIHTRHISPASVHVRAAYLWIIPFGILEVCFLISYIVRYLAWPSFHDSCIVDYTKTYYTEATRKYDSMKLNEARFHTTPDCCDACME